MRKGAEAGALAASFRRFLYILANLFGGAVLVLLLLDPTRPLGPIFIRLGLAVVCAVAPRFLPDRCQKTQMRNLRRTDTRRALVESRRRIQIQPEALDMDRFYVDVEDHSYLTHARSLVMWCRPLGGGRSSARGFTVL
jgi:hypothetical protein